MGFFPVDEETLGYLRLTGRDEKHVGLVERYTKEQGLFRTAASPEPIFTDAVELDLSKIEPCLAGPKRPQDRVGLSKREGGLPQGPARPDWPTAASGSRRRRSGRKASMPAARGAAARPRRDARSATASSSSRRSPPARTRATRRSSSPRACSRRRPSRRASSPSPWVKTSLAPGSRVVTDYLEAAGLAKYLDQLGFQTVGYGCTTCIGNSGPAARRGLEGAQGLRARRRGRDLGQPQLRGARPPRGEGELPREPAARRRVRDRRHGRPRPDDRTARHRAVTASPSS